MSTTPIFEGRCWVLMASGLALIAIGLFAGFFSVPLQVYLQASALWNKGRIIGAWNLMNWIGIAGGVVYSIGQLILVDWLQLPYATLFAFAGILMLPVAVFIGRQMQIVTASSAAT